jgi:hypothetical protein
MLNTIIAEEGKHQCKGLPGRDGVVLSRNIGSAKLWGGDRRDRQHRWRATFGQGGVSGYRKSHVTESPDIFPNFSPQPELAALASAVKSMAFTLECGLLYLLARRNMRWSVFG